MGALYESYFLLLTSDIIFSLIRQMVQINPDDSVHFDNNNL